MFKKIIEKKRREKRIKDGEENPEEEEKVNKTFIMAKIENDEAKSLINTQFQDSNNYLDVNPKMIIGILKI